MLFWMDLEEEIHGTLSITSQYAHPYQPDLMTPQHPVLPITPSVLLS